MRITEPFIDEVNRNIADLQEIKSNQFIGKGSILSYKMSSDDLYDVTFFSDQLQDNYLVTFNHNSARRQIINLSIFTRVNNPDVMDDPIIITGTVPPVITRWKKVAPPATGLTQWRVSFINSSWGITNTTYTVYAKLFFEGTDFGTWSIDPV